ncbi:MAG TPA: LysM peptidoglycan-binding domain-containing protein [Verrucomicrobiota bacterium]|nr:LysM peptidoglycan-binding domain-containing protein [Verrucomicrobiota bacterium]
MSSHNPLRPKSSLLEQKAKSRSGLQIVMIIVAVHVVFLGGLLFSGCRPEQPASDTVTNTNTIPVLPPIGGEVASPPDTNMVTVVEPPTNATPAAPPLPTTGEPKPPPVTRDTESVEDIVPLVPEPTGEPEVPVAAGEIEYVVAKGDNFTIIARKHGVTVQAIAKANPAVEPNRIAIGQVLIIPASAPKPAAPALPEGTVVYEVKAGDSLYAIAQEHKTSVKAIRDANNLTTSKIQPGQKLTIPSPPTDN